MLSRSSTRACGGLLLLGLLALSVGCTNKYKARATVKGKVTFAGKALTAGNVVFSGKDPSITGSSAIDKDGNYRMTDAPLGEVKITVSVPQLPLGGMGATTGRSGTKGLKDSESVNPDNPGQRITIMGQMPSHVLPVPEKYAKVETTPLTYTVEKGEHTHDITLTP
jgi:hypothetical protein